MASVSFTPNHQPSPACYPSDVNGMLDLLTTGGGLSGSIPDTAGGGVFVGSAPPSSSLTNKVWYKTDAAGRPLGVFMFYNGNWRKVYTGATIGEIRMMWYSSGLFDGSGRGIIGGDMDGWAICNGQNGTPNLQGFFPVGGVQGQYVSQQTDVWFTDADGVAWRQSGGRKGPVTITAQNLPALSVNIPYTSNRVPGGPSGPNTHFPDGSLPKQNYQINETIGSPNSVLPFPLLYMALGFVMFVGYQ